MSLGQLSLHSELQDNQGYIMRFCLKRRRRGKRKEWAEGSSVGFSGTAVIYGWLYTIMWVLGIDRSLCFYFHTLTPHTYTHTLVNFMI